MRSCGWCLWVVAMFIVSSTASGEIQSSDSWVVLADDGDVAGDGAGSEASITSAGEGNWLQSGAEGSMSMWTTVAASLDWEYFIGVEGYAQASCWDEQPTLAVGIADASGEGAGFSDSLQAVAVVALEEFGGDTVHDWGGAPDGIWQCSTSPHPFGAGQGFSMSHDVGAVACAALGSSNRAEARAYADAWCIMVVP